MNVCDVLNVDFKRLNPIYNLVASVIDFKNAMDDRLIVFNTLIY